MENRGSRPFGYWDSSYRAKLRRTWIALPFCIVAARYDDNELPR